MLCVGSFYNMITNSKPYISVDFWITISDITITESDKKSEYKDEIKKASENSNKLLRIFLKSDLLWDYCDLILKIDKPFILITSSNSDTAPPTIICRADKRKLKKWKNIKIKELLNKQQLLHWFTKNPSIVHQKIHPLPLGPKWQFKSREFFGEDKTNMIEIYNNLCKNPKKKFLDKKLKSNMLYFNFNGGTTDRPFFNAHTGIRCKIKNELEKRFKWNENKPFQEYIETLSTYKFCISPPGKGIDTHRCWESLMVGTIPIMISTTLDKLFEKLPVLIVKDYSMINENFLMSNYEKIYKRIDEYDFSILYTDYWVDLISSIQ